MFAATAALALALSQTASPSPTASAQVTFAFEDAQLDPATYTLLIREDGSGHYQSTPGPAPAPNAIDGVAGAPVGRDIEVRDPLLSAFFQTARSHRLFATACDAPSSHVAFTGKKTVSYTGPDGHGECTFNWSRDQQLNQLAADLMAIAYTIDEGRRLATEHVHSRLSLDAELEALQDAFKDRRALEIENISAELESIANDEAVMNRARNRARALLSGSAKH
jgi:hypothetical protein